MCDNNTYMHIKITQTHACSCRVVTDETGIISIGIAVGFIVFWPMFFGIGFLDIYLKKKADEDLQQKMKEAKQREKRKKMGQMMVKKK